MGHILLRWILMGFSTTTKSCASYSQVENVGEMNVQEAIVRKLDKLTRADQDKILELVEKLIEVESHRREFNDLQRPIVWVS